MSSSSVVKSIVVLGGDPVKHRLRDDLLSIFEAARKFFDDDP